MYVCVYKDVYSPVFIWGCVCGYICDIYTQSGGLWRAYDVLELLTFDMLQYLDHNILIPKTIKTFF